MNQITSYTPAALYARVSSDRQDVGLSVAAQLRALRDYAQKNGYLVAREYVDEAESGRIADRPKFRKMIDEASKPNAPFQEILVWKLSCFTRKREHAVAFKSMLRRKGVRVVSITEHADDTPTGKLLEGIIESVDEFYSENLAQEVMRGMRESAFQRTSRWQETQVYFRPADDSLDHPRPFHGVSDMPAPVGSHSPGPIDQVSDRSGVPRRYPAFPGRGSSGSAGCPGRRS